MRPDLIVPGVQFKIKNAPVERLKGRVGIVKEVTRDGFILFTVPSKLNTKPDIGTGIFDLDFFMKNCVVLQKEEPMHFVHKIRMDSDPLIASIYTDGHIVKAVLDDWVGIAKCNPEDEFNLYTGERIAYYRLKIAMNEYLAQRAIDGYRPGTIKEVL